MQALVLTLLLLFAPAAKRSDADIEADIRARLSRSKIAVNGFQVKVRNGTAVWTGKTGVIQHKGAATRMAKAAGATHVENRIEISDAARAKSAANLAKGQKPAPRTETPPAPAATGTPAAPAPASAGNDGFVPPPVRRAVVKK